MSRSSSKTPHVSFKTASVAFGIPEDTIRMKLRQKAIPPYIIKKANNRYYVDTSHPAWKEYVEGRKGKAKKKDASDDGFDDLVNPDDDEQMKDLWRQSKAAKMNEQILKTKKLEYAVEKEHLSLQSAAQEVVEVGFAEFLWYGYMEKMNVDLLGMMKRLDPIIDNLVKAGDSAGVRKRIEKEITAIIHEVKKAQKAEAIKWRREGGNA